MKNHSHTTLIDGKKHIWFAESLWKISADLPRFEYRISDFSGFDQDYWFGDRIKPTIAEVIRHHHKIMNADYSYPIIISETGLIMDGVHRICRAHIEKKETILAVRFNKNPAPDQII